jgi:hypothetical protein
MKIEALGYIKEGGLKILNRKRFEADLKEVKDCDVEVIVKKRGKRSSPQNKFYWSAVITTIRLELVRLGNRVDNETVHEFLKEKFNPVYLYNEDGEVIAKVGGSTTKLTKEEFTEYLERVLEWASSTLEVSIPPPVSQTEIIM